MAVRVADSLKQQNDLKTFPVAYSEDIWIDKNKGEGDADYKDLQTLYNEGALGGSGLPEPESKDKLLVSTENEETSELEWSQIDKGTIDGSAYVNLDVGSDLNTLVTHGRFRTTTKRIDRIENLPVQVAGMLTVRLTGSVIYQTYNSIDNKMYTRTSEDAGENWSDWKDVSEGGDEPFIGTKEEWEALSLEEKAKYKIVNFLDDDGSSGGTKVYTTENKSSVTVGGSWAKLIQTSAKKSGNCIIGVEMTVPNATRTQYFQVLAGTKSYTLIFNTHSGYGQNLTGTVIVPNIKEGDNIQISCALTDGSMTVTYSSITEMYV